MEAKFRTYYQGELYVVTLMVVPFGTIMSQWWFMRSRVERWMAKRRNISRKANL